MLVENSIVGDPVVECGADSILLAFRTEKTFNGRLYVEGESEKSGCSKNAEKTKPDGRKVDFRIRFGDCNMRRQRTLSPRGVTFSLTVITSFHPLFVTGLDRAFHVRCFFTEAVKSVESKIDVFGMSTETIERHFVLPECNYELRKNFEGPPLKFAGVGDPVTHVWQCDEIAGLVYGILVHSCFVDDGHGNRFPLLDERGCAVDRFLLGDLQYDSQAIGAYVDSHVFKYADRIQLFFTCTVQLCFKDDGGCQGITPPRCGHLGSSPGPPIRPKFHRRPQQQLQPQPRPPVFPLSFESEEFPRSSEDQKTLSENTFPEERRANNFNSPAKNEFFGLIRARNRRPFSIERKEPPGNSFGATGYEISPFGSPFKDSPLANETDVESGDSESFVDEIRNFTEVGVDLKNKRENRATKQMESDVTAELTVMPIENEFSSTDRAEIPRFSLKRHCFSMFTLVIFTFMTLASIFVSSMITAVIGRKYWQGTKGLHLLPK